VPANHVESEHAGPSAEERRARIVAEIESLGTAHEWAGEYGRFHIDSGSSLYVAPDAGWVWEDYDVSSRYVVGFGQLKSERGHLTFVAEFIDSPRRPPRAMWIVHWGERRYLLDDEGCVEFANRINSRRARFSRMAMGWYRNLRAPVEGLPQLPTDCPVHLFTTPIEFEVLEVGAGEPVAAAGRVMKHRAVLRGGLDAHAFAGMKLFGMCPDARERCPEHYRELEITRVDDTTCTGTEIVREFGTPVAPGTRVSTREPGL
jgi:hypothetical protein